MDDIINDIRSLFREAKIFFRATINKFISDKTKLDDETTDIELPGSINNGNEKEIKDPDST